MERSRNVQTSSADSLFDSAVNRRPPFSAVALWVLVCALLNVTGWVLSALHQLNRAGYLVVLSFTLAAALYWRLNHSPPEAKRRTWSQIPVRFKRGLPLGFLILATLAFLGGALYFPSNYDGLAYRTPRVLNWLAEGRWHWIHTDFGRLNTRACGFEWLSAPLIALTKTDRLFFLINFIPFALMPGLVFSVFTRLGVPLKVAWRWMWIIPGGYCYLLQAGSIGNDLPGAVFALAAVDFALRARRSGRCEELWISILAAALMTGAKASNLPLLLPWLIAAWPALPLAGRRLAGTAVVCLIAAGVSVLPNSALNIKYCGDWTGMPAEGATANRGNPLVYLTWNLILIPVQNLAPPIFPLASAWNQNPQRVFPAALIADVENLFEAGGAHLDLGELQIEEVAGLGFGVCVLLLASFVAGLFKPAASDRVQAWQRAILAATFVALLAFMAKSGFSAGGRLLTPYYALLAPALLLSRAQEQFVRRRWWKRAATTVFLLAALLVIVQPARPLWPANFVLERLRERNVAPGLVARAAAVYAGYSRRGDAFAPAREALPSDANPLGIITHDDPETSLWRPFGSRRIQHLRVADTNEAIRARQIRYVLISNEKLSMLTGGSAIDWITAHHAEVLKTIPLRLRVTSINKTRETTSLDWTLVKIPDADKP